MLPLLKAHQVQTIPRIEFSSFLFFYYMNIFILYSKYILQYFFLSITSKSFFREIYKIYLQLDKYIYVLLLFTGYQDGAM